MAKDEKPANIFEAARQMFSRKKKEKPKEATPSSLHPQEKSVEERPSPSSALPAESLPIPGAAPKQSSVESPIQQALEKPLPEVFKEHKPSEADLAAYEDLSAAFDRIKEYHSELEGLFKKACDKAKLSPKEISNFLRTEENFAPSEWDFVRQKRKEESEKLWRMAGENVKQKYLQRMKKKKARKRKGKFLGARRQGWIQVK